MKPMNAFEGLRKQLESTVPASGVLLVSQEDGREILDTYDRLQRQLDTYGFRRLSRPSGEPRPAA